MVGIHHGQDGEPAAQLSGSYSVAGESGDVVFVPENDVATNAARVRCSAKISGSSERLLGNENDPDTSHSPLTIGVTCSAAEHLATAVGGVPHETSKHGDPSISVGMHLDDPRTWEERSSEVIPGVRLNISPDWYPAGCQYGVTNWQPNEPPFNQDSCNTFCGDDDHATRAWQMDVTEASGEVVDEDGRVSPDFRRVVRLSGAIVLEDGDTSCEPLMLSLSLEFVVDSDNYAYVDDLCRD